MHYLCKTLERKTTHTALYSLLIVVLTLSACSPTRFLDEGESMLSSVKMKSLSKQIKASDYRNYVRQEPNSRWFNLVKVPLGIYCLSSSDSTKALSKFFRRIGQAPVVYDTLKTRYSQSLLQSSLQSKGFLHAEVEVDTQTSKQKTHVNYILDPGRQSYIRNIDYTFDNDSIREKVLSLISLKDLATGMPLDLTKLNALRNRIIDSLQNNGYYLINRDYLTFTADTMSNDLGVDLHMHFRRPHGSLPDAYRQFHIRKVNVYEYVNDTTASDSSTYHHLNLYYHKRLNLYRRVYHNHISIGQGSLYSEQKMRDTYSRLSTLQNIKYSAIRFAQVPDENGQKQLDANIYVQLSPRYGISAEIDGTNTQGDLGAALSLTFTHRNLFRGAETFTLKLRGAFEAIKGLEGYNNQNYIEYNVEAGLTMPTFRFPFLSRNASQNLRTQSKLAFSYNTQNRPEFHRRVLTGNWSYNWTHRNKPNASHRLDLVSLNYIFLPWISRTFEDTYLKGTDPRSSILRNSYENLFIMRSAYGFSYNSSRNSGSSNVQNNSYQIKVNAEIAGNLLYALSHLLHGHRDSIGQYNIFNIAYSQYAKFDFDWAKSIAINESNSLAMHFAAGVAIPYGNSKIIPYEKRYFAGGANHVRGWSVRSLGPGSYTTNDGKINYINQTGNLQLLASIEYRTHLFWKFNGAIFVDAGNIWNTHTYENLRGAQFKLKNFVNEIAVSYGIGIRFNFDYFIIRFDGGMKAINPAEPTSSDLHYPIIHPKFSRDFTLHFAVGLPF